MRSNWDWKTTLQVCVIVFLSILNVDAIDIDRVCPRMLQKVFKGYAPIGNDSYIH